MTAATRILFIGLDGAEPALVARDGAPPVLGGLLERGAVIDIDSLPDIRRARAE